MSLPAYLYKDKVVGWRPDIPAGLQAVIRRIVEHDLAADVARSYCTRRREFRLKDEAMQEAYRRFPRNFIIQRGSDGLAFVSKVMYPAHQEGGFRLRAHVPLKVLRTTDGWSAYEDELIEKARRWKKRRIVIAKQLHRWPEDMRTGDDTPWLVVPPLRLITA